MGKALLFVGGTRSGKSGMALRWAEAQAPHRLYLATGRADDEEMTARIARHKAERGSGWLCSEEPLDPAAVLAGVARKSAGGSDNCAAGVVLLDCVSLWVANLMAADMAEKDILDRVDALAAVIADYPLPLVLVSVEAGLGMVAMSSLGRRFQDTLGLANQALARVCDTVLFVSCGLPLVLKGQLPEEIC
ncbi:MAG: bifunctional adenosylcobinamide kinase/adenosylcobinamide-phosphate guanylyltransferase [Desulfovibrio sp.]|uniref:bifunctional adenosylcobinamide kinase/adenosylcobinamide-phosphate guanylyltransferase n=1 Tax=Desulfovibrio sp. TaxID=885 RepID=UPI00135E323E|nr:bifunctional adenosylcobinamide kinase/adenosylcobinamide-phosphate guanylyltransferase [Desulfovibrio sp.]MTJ93745.1 bifunctional adenosylcobinamide kinase/adenosylcobinamide-phosphate guanylyltransferase [Desulfovibrio sp.]